MLPPGTDRVDSELAGFVADPDRDHSLIGTEVIYAVGDRVPQLFVFEVVGAHLHPPARPPRRRRLRPPRPPRTSAPSPPRLGRLPRARLAQPTPDRVLRDPRRARDRSDPPPPARLRLARRPQPPLALVQLRANPSKP